MFLSLTDLHLRVKKNPFPISGLNYIGATTVTDTYIRAKKVISHLWIKLQIYGKKRSTKLILQV